MKRSIETVEEIRHLPLSSLQLHADADKVPRMRPDEWTAFLADVNKRGVQEPIVVQDGGVILDGRNRFEAAELRGDETIPCRTVDLSPTEQVEYLIKSAYLRRHLNDSQRGVLAAQFAEPLKKAAQKEASQTAHKARYQPETCDLSPPDKTQKRDTRKQVAEQFNISEKTVQKATVVLKKDPEMAQKVLAGEVSLNKALREVAPESSLVKAAPTKKPRGKSAKKSKQCLTIVESLDELYRGLTEAIKSVVATEGRLSTHSFDVAEQEKRLRMARKLVTQVRSTVKGE